MSDLPPLPVDTITGKDILEMLNAPTQYDKFKRFAESGKLCSPHNPAFQGRGKDDERSVRMKDNLHIYEKRIHPRLQIGNYFLMIMGERRSYQYQPRKNAKFWLCQVYESKERQFSIKFMGRYIRYKYFNILETKKSGSKTTGYVTWEDEGKFNQFKTKVFDVSREMQETGSGSWNKDILHFHIFRDIIDLDFINWPFEKPQGLI